MSCANVKQTLAMLAAAAALAVPWLAGCHVGYPFRGPGYDAKLGVVHPLAGDEVFIAVTQGDIAAGGGCRFAAQRRSVLASMQQHDGLIGVAMRRQLLGSRVWTMSAWIDRASMDKFARSPAHRRAVAQGAIPSSSFLSAFTLLEADRVPLSWAEAERMLAETERKHQGGGPHEPAR